MIENSYIDYSLVSVQIYQHKRRREFVQNLNNCDNCEARYLLHGTRVDPISLILTDEFKYTRKAFYGMGIYFTDMIDYVSFYCGGDSLRTRRDFWNKIIPVGDTISCIASEVYYDINKKHKIYKQTTVVLDHFPTYDEIKKDYEDQMVEENGINFIEVETIKGHALKSKEGIDIAIGTVDTNYRGEVMACVINNTSKDYVIHKGDRICQLAIRKAPIISWKIVEELSDTERGSNGFGSSGIK